jgi:hypothetical protein
VQAGTEASEVQILLRLLILAIWRFIYATIGDSSCLLACLLAAAAETGLECWYSFENILIDSRTFLQKFLPSARPVCRDFKKENRNSTLSQRSGLFLQQLSIFT